MPDYADILRFLADNPPGPTAERNLHASLLELIANCLRAEDEANALEARRAAELIGGNSRPVN
jgi:hypothetical protein